MIMRQIFGSIKKVKHKVGMYRKYSKITPWRKNRLLDFCAMVLFIEKMQLKMQLSRNQNITMAQKSSNRFSRHGVIFEYLRYISFYFTICN